MTRIYQPAGYGQSRWSGTEPLERRSEVAAGGSIAEAPARVTIAQTPVNSATWAELVQAGWDRIFHLTIDGIPVTFPERQTLTMMGKLVRAPTYYLECAALFVDDALEFSVDANRETGLAAGRAMDFTLAWGAMEDTGVGALIFRRPTVKAALTASVTSASASRFLVDSTAGFSVGTGYYIGHEYIIPSGATSTSFEGCKRGVCGRPYYHVSNTGSGFRYVTDAPLFWRGRLVTLWETLVSPEGRAVSDTWATLGPWTRQAWRGYLDDDPSPSDAGMVLRAVPLTSLLNEELGVKVRGEVNFDSQGFPYPLGVDAGDFLRVQEEAGSASDYQGPARPDAISLTSLTTWAAIAQQNIAALSGADRIVIRADASGWSINVRARYSGEVVHTFSLFSYAWFAGGVANAQSQGVGSATYATAKVPLTFNVRGPSWLPVRFEANEDGSAADLPLSGGVGYLEVNGQRETVSWDRIRRLTGADDTQPMALRLTGRALGPGQSMLDWSRGGTFTVVSGARGTWAEVFMTLATSSGLGTRSAYDKLPVGYGLGLAQDDIEVGTIDRLGGSVMDAFAPGKASMADMLCGWAALKRFCVIQRRGTDGVIRLALVPTDPTDDPSGDTITAADVLLGGSSTPDRVPGPNQVEIDASSGDVTRKYLVRDRPRIQAERGARGWSVKAPGITEVEALFWGGSMLRLSDGQATKELEVPAHDERQVGDAVTLTTAHPTDYDWSTGARGPASIPARVVGIGQKLTGRKRLTLLLAGQAQESYLLAPSPVVTHVVTGGATIRLKNADAEWFAVSDAVYLYTPGRSAQAATISSMGTPGDTETAITLSVSTPSWATVADGVRLTFREYTNDVVRQRRFMFVRSDRYWR